MHYTYETIYMIANWSPISIVPGIFLVLLIGVVIAYFLKKEERLFWSLFVITIANLLLGYFFAVSVNVSIGLILLVVLIAMMINKFSRSQAKMIEE